MFKHQADRAEAEGKPDMDALFRYIYCENDILFQSTPRIGGDLAKAAGGLPEHISIHAPRMGGDTP